MGMTNRKQSEAMSFDTAVEHLLNAPVEKLKLQEEAWRKFGKPCPPNNAYVYAIQSLGDITGKTILDYGCGNGYLSCILARRGAAKVYAIDISAKSILVAKKRAEIDFFEGKVFPEVMSAYKLRYPNEMFDLSIGLDILHHIDIKAAIDELVRVVKKGGKAVFMEPFGDSKLFQRLRRLMPVRKAVLAGSLERPLTYGDLQILKEKFTSCDLKEFQLFSRLDRVIKNRNINFGINKLDEHLFYYFPFLRRYARQIVIKLVK